MTLFEGPLVTKCPYYKVASVRWFLYTHHCAHEEQESIQSSGCGYSHCHGDSSGYSDPIS